MRLQETLYLNFNVSQATKPVANEDEAEPY